MKRIPIGVAVIFAVLLILFGVVFGTVRGLTDERKKVESLLTRDGGLYDLLFDRGADGVNLCKVARRHLIQNDESILSLERYAEILMSEETELEEKKQANDMLEPAFETVRDKVSATQTCMASQRDRNYLEMLHKDLLAISAAEAVQAYNRAAESFNDQLKKPFSGYLAGLFQIKACKLFM